MRFFTYHNVMDFGPGLKDGLKHGVKYIVNRNFNHPRSCRIHADWAVRL